MKKIEFTTHILPNVVAIAVFFIITIFFFNPVFFENKTLQQEDIQQFIGSSKAIEDYRKATGEEPLWTNSMFSGMPAYLISVQWGNQAIAYIKKVMTLLLPHPIANIFIAFVSYYIMLLCFGIRPFLAIAGAIAFGLSSYMIVGLAAGHNGRIGAIAFMPLVMAGIHLTFTGRRILGFGLTAAAMALHLRENHVQITYYLLLIVLVYGLIRLIDAIKNRSFPELLKVVGVLVLAVLLGAGTFFGQFWALKEYGAYSTRGKSDLASPSNQGQEDAMGMTKEYAFEFSNGILEPFTLMIPNFYGGSSFNFLVSDRQSGVYQALVRSGDQQNANRLANFTGAYWGDQRIAVPYYAGAVIIFLFVLGIVFAEKKYVWWLVSISALGIVLSWGSSFSAFNYFMYDYFPGYNNFRSVTFTLILILFAMPLLGLLGLERLLLAGMDKKAKHRLLIIFASTGGLCLVLWLFAGIFSFTREMETQLPAWFADALADDRKSLFRADALRSFFFILAVFLAIYFGAHKRVSAIGFYAFLIFIVTVDLAVVDKRYFTAENFRRTRDNTFFAITEADQEILKDKSYYRVYNLSYLTGSSANTFGEARTSYYHHSIGGYHAAKMRRYAEFYDSCMVTQTQKFVEQVTQGNTTFDLPAFNMLNVKYIVIGSQRENILPNPSAYGNAWFVQKIVTTGDAVAELEQTCSVNTRTTAVIDTSKFQVKSISPDSAATIRLIDSSPKNLKYESQSSGNGLAVFSEIYYPGWEATIDGKETTIARVDYILRALEVPAGNHTIEFTFKPKPYTVGNKVTTASSWLVLIVLVGSIYWSLSNGNEIRTKKV
ncbi:MAG: YfhO family protein [Cyclobacteriaceae bacterium]